MSYKIEKTKTQKEIIDFKAEYLQDCFGRGYNLVFAEDENYIYALEEYEKLQNGEVVDISQTPEYIAEQNKKAIQAAKTIRDTAINEITNAKLLDDLQLDAGTITQAIYNARKTARLAQLAEVQTTFYTTTGLTQPTTITA